MRSIRPLTNSLSKRPSIHEIAASILTPTSSCHAQQFQQLRRLPKASKPSLLPQTLSVSHSRTLHTTTSFTSSSSSHAPKSHDRGPPSSETTQTDFGNLDVLGGTPVPSTSIDACLWDGFHLNNGVKITQGAGCLLVGGEAFGWRPWDAGKVKGGKNVGVRLLNSKGQWEVDDDAWGLLQVVWPKPDLLILGLGPVMAPLSPATRKFINSLGVRVDVQDTRNAAAQFNLLATERGLGSVAAALIPLGWREGVGVK